MQSQLTKSAARIYSVIEPDLNKVRSLIDEQVASVNPATEDILAYIRLHHGKMLRPALVLLAGRCCGQITALHIQIATIAELIHTATLLHDDVIDESPQRRNHRTVNSRHGNEAAVLAGDFIFSKVFRMCAELPDQRVSKVLADTCSRICQGELEQNFHRRNWQLSEAEYISIITEKSASFLSSCCYLGAIAADAGPVDAAALANFGLNIGIAFQIVDDVLDIVGNEREMGKRAGSDFDMNKLTLPVIRLLSNAGNRLDLIKSFSDCNQSRESRNALLKQHGSVDYAYACAAEYHKTAIEALNGLEPGIAKTALIETADFCIARAG